MKQLLTQILTLPRQQKIGILAGLIIFLLVIGYFYVYLPGDDKATKLAEEITAVRGDRDKRKPYRLISRGCKKSCRSGMQNLRPRWRSCLIARRFPIF